MNTILLRSSISINQFPPFLQNETFDRGDKILTMSYDDGEIKYKVHCKSSICNMNYIFNGNDLGIAVFDKETELFMDSTKPINSKYFLFLKRSIKIWKKHFSHI
jgi:hypothetical protein